MEREKVSLNFYADEFACKGSDCCGNTSAIDLSLIEGLEELRSLVKIRMGANKPILITSGFRCKKHNEEIEGAINSRHTRGLAADIQAKGVPVSVLFECALEVKQFKLGGIGLYNNRIHVDVGTGPRRWEVL